MVNSLQIKCKFNLTFLFFLDATKIVFLHSESVSSILNRKPISKEMLYKYLTDNNIPVTNNFTKATLIEQVIEFWRRNEHPERIQQNNLNSTSTTTTMNPELFPVNVMAKNFSSWFFKNYNESMLQPHDFWSDCTCIVKMIDNSGDMKQDSTVTSHHVLNLLLSIKTQFNFFFNPNCSYDGTRGK